MSRNATKKAGSKRRTTSSVDAGSDRRIAREIHTLALRIRSELAAREQRAAFAAALPTGPWNADAWGGLPHHGPQAWGPAFVDPHGRR